MPKLAVVGTDGSGKTVLLTTLAKRLAAGSGTGTISAANRDTYQFVETTWVTLQRQEWPPSTPPGELIKLHWKLDAGGGVVGDMVIHDCAGQDLRFLFAEDGVVDPALGPEKRRLIEAIRAADVVLFVANLADFVGESDERRRIDNQWFLQNAMKFAAGAGRGKKFCLVFAQADQYAAYLRQHGTWLAVAKSLMPEVHAVHLESGKVEILGVSAVRDTTVVDDPVAGARRVPRAGFGSEGIDALGGWLLGSIRRRQHLEAAPHAVGAALVAAFAVLLLGYAVLWNFYPVRETKIVTTQFPQPVFEQFPIYKKVTKYYLFGIEMSFGVPYEFEVISHYEQRQVGTKTVTKNDELSEPVGIGPGNWIGLSLVTAAAAMIASGSTFLYKLNKLGREAV